jgi:hypothetical protein
MDGKRGKPLAQIMGPNPKGINGVELMTSPTDHKGRYLTSISRPLELTLGALLQRVNIIFQLLCFSSTSTKEVTHPSTFPLRLPYKQFFMIKRKRTINT